MLTLMLPNLFAIDDARSIDAACMKEVVKKIDPSLPSSRSNLPLKKYVIHDLEHVSNVNKTQRVHTKTRDSKQMNPKQAKSKD